MIYIEAEDERGFPMWDVYAECGHWGLFFMFRRVRRKWIDVPVYRHSIINMEGIC